MGKGNDWDDKSIENIFKKKRETRGVNTRKQETPPKPVPVRTAADLSPAEKRERALARKRFLRQRAQTARRRRVFALLFLAVTLVLLSVFVVAAFRAIQSRFFGGSGAEHNSGDDLSAFHAFLSSDDIFYSAENAEDITLLNQMLHTYTLADDGNYAVKNIKNEPSYYEWDAMKYAWYGDKTYLSALKESIKNIAVAKNGYVWSEENFAIHPVSGSYLYDTNIKFISAVCTLCLWEGNDDFLFSSDTTTAGSLDVSQGKTVGEKLDLAIAYVLDTQYNDKNNLFYDSYERNNGTESGAPSNYWYHFRFGHLDAYNNIYFNNAMTKLCALYHMKGDTENADHYGKIALLNREAFNTFWDSGKGRYVGAIDINGIRRDYGFVCLNLEAIYYGLADGAKAEIILSWLDGERIIPGDSSTGSDIYAHGFAPRNTTLAAEALWWNDLDNRVPLSSSSFGEYYQNGGSSLLTSFYDIMARLKTSGLKSAAARVHGLASEYKKDKLLRNPAGGAISGIQYATNGNFPESGLAPTVFVYGLMGIGTDGKTLQIHPRKQEGQGPIGVKKVGFARNVYHILADNQTVYIAADNLSPVRINLGGYLPGQTANCVFYEGDAAVLTKELRADSGGNLYIEEAFGGGSFIKIAAE